MKIHLNFGFRKKNTARVVDYWNERYKRGGNSGEGSRGKFADYKSKVLREFIESHKIETITDLGCGDAYNFDLVNFTGKYRGYDISKFVVDMNNLNKIKSNFNYYVLEKETDYNSVVISQLSMSMDVIMHLVNNYDFDLYMNTLFNSSSQFVAIFNTSTNEQISNMSWHNFYRNEGDWVLRNRTNWVIISEEIPPNELGFPRETKFTFWTKK